MSSLPGKLVIPLLLMKEALLGGFIVIFVVDMSDEALHSFLFAYLITVNSCTRLQLIAFTF